MAANLVAGSQVLTRPQALESCRSQTSPATSRSSLYGHCGPFRQHSCQTRSSRTCGPMAVATAAGVQHGRVSSDMWNSTYYPTGSDANTMYKQWYIVDAEGQTLGRLATHVATYIRGKHKPTYHPAMDMGGYVVVINAEKVVVTGNKTNLKEYKRHTNGRPGSMKTETFAQLQKRIPERIIEKAVKGMVTKGRLGNQLFTHLKVYKGPEHPHSAQKPIDITNGIDKKPSDMVKRPTA